MEQLCIFQSSVQDAITWTLYIDGASRGNPGHSGAGIVIYKKDVLMQQEGYYLGVKTNNQAEYLALLLGVFLVKSFMQNDDQLIVISDSELLIRQLKGIYKVKNQELHKLFKIAQWLLADVSCQVRHVLREQNVEADAMANKGVDTKHEAPATFKRLLQLHHITF